MADPKILIVGSCYIDTPIRKQETELWARLTAKQNPGVDVVMLDSCSPFEPKEIIGKTDLKVQAYESFADNIGCVTRGGRDGSGRAFCRALELGAELGYDYVIPWETDVLWFPPVRPIIDKMHRAGVKVAATFANPFQFMEFGVCFWRSDYVARSKFVERYDYQHAPPWPMPEMRIANLLENDLFILPLTGYRNSGHGMNIMNITNLFPYKLPEFLTHCADINVYTRWLDLKGVQLT